MGGYDLPHTQTTLLFPDGGSQPSFDLKDKSIYSCAIDDPKNGTVILTGGFELNSTSTSRVARYGPEGFIEYLPDMEHSRHFHGCAGYYNDDDQLVKRMMF